MKKSLAHSKMYFIYIRDARERKEKNQNIIREQLTTNNFRALVIGHMISKNILRRKRSMKKKKNRKKGTLRREKRDGGYLDILWSLW